jgi:hypothetical protein
MYECLAFVDHRTKGFALRRRASPLFIPAPHRHFFATRRMTGRVFNCLHLTMFPPFTVESSGSVEKPMVALNRKLTRVLSSKSMLRAVYSSSFANRTCRITLPIKAGYSTPSPLAFTVFCFNVPPSTEPESESLQDWEGFGAFGQQISDIKLNGVEEFCYATNGQLAVAEFPRSEHFDVQAVKRD